MRHQEFFLSILLLVIMTDYSSENRGKRSLITIGNAALRKLLKDARPLRYDPAQKIFYSKPGGYRQAVKDFRSVKPKDVGQLSRRISTGEVLVNGRIGDRVIQLVKGTEDRNTMLNIYRLGKTKKTKTYVNIMYID